MGVSEGGVESLPWQSSVDTCEVVGCGVRGVHGDLEPSRGCRDAGADPQELEL